MLSLSHRSGTGCQVKKNQKYTKFFQESEKSNPKTRSGGRASRVKNVFSGNPVENRNTSAKVSEMQMQ